jgi:23S rRNA pseudouridine1911/1915/1917 synthase
MLDGDILKDMDLDLPETPEAANASPTFLRPGIVHRLDKGTSGVLIAGRVWSFMISYLDERYQYYSLLTFDRHRYHICLTIIIGKSAGAVANLSKLFALREVRKVYLAVCVGHPGETTIVNPIGRSPKNRQLMCAYEGPPGKPAISHVRTLFFDGKMSVCLVRIETGR